MKDHQTTVRNYKEPNIFIVGLETEVEPYRKRDACKDIGLKELNIPVVISPNPWVQKGHTEVELIILDVVVVKVCSSVRVGS